VGYSSSEGMNNTTPAPGEVPAQLELLLASPQFRNAPSLTRFLRFVVEHTLDGDTTDLKESIIGIKVFDRGADFDPKADSIVRMQAANLRTRLAKYYENAPGSPVRIDIPKGGYLARFESQAVAPAPPPEPPKKLRWWLPVVAGIAALGALALVVIWSKSAEQIASVAVLPFADFSAAHELDYFCDGLSEEIIDSLAKVPGLRVAARTSAFSFKGKAEDVRIIGRKLGVAAVMEGSIQKQGDYLRITVQLNRVSDGSHLWSDYFDRPAGDLLQVETEIARAIAARVTRHATSPASSFSMDPEAYRLYLEARYFKEQDSPEPMAKSIERFQQAAARDPNRAVIWAGLAEAYYLQADLGAATLSQVMPHIREAAEKAVALDSRSAEAHFALGIIHLTWDLQWSAAEKEFRQAVSLSPGNAYGRDWLGESLWALNRFPEATQQFDLALAADPLSPIIILDVAINQSLQGNQAKAAALIQQALDLHPGLAALDKNLACELAAMGGLGRARHLVEITPGDENGLFREAGQRCVDVATHDLTDLRRVLQNIDRLAPPERASLPHAGIYSQLGDEAATRLWLERTCQNHDPELYILGADTNFSPTDPAYRETLQKLHLTRGTIPPSLIDKR